MFLRISRSIDDMKGAVLMPKEDEMFSLARYFVWADLMRDLLNQSLGRDDAVNPDGSPGVTTFATMSYWYSSLYVVIEGWQELQLSDETLDKLLSDTDKVQDLKWYRNATFHFQKKLYHDKFLRFMRGGDETSDWIHEVHRAFQRFFTEWMRAEGHLDDEVLKSYEEWRAKHPSAKMP